MSTDPDTGSDVQPGCLPPRERYDLFGHETAEQAFADAWQSGRLHHAWMITGPRGVGKASLAWRAARRVLGAREMPEAGPLGASAQDPVCKLIESQATPDLLLLRRPWDDKRKRWRAEITVEEARRAPHFFEMSSGGGGWRVCIVDSADDMNNNAANALLKTLEEPPQRGVLFLIAHTPGRLPATIRSRCRRLNLRAPTVDATADWLETTGSASDAGAALAASKLAGGAPGRALGLIAGGGVELAAEVNLLVDRGAAASDADIRKLAERLSLKGQEEMRGLFFEVLGNAIRNQARDRAEAGRDAIDWLDNWRDLNTLVRDANALYLDPRQTMLSALVRVRDVARKEKARA